MKLPNVQHSTFSRYFIPLKTLLFQIIGMYSAKLYEKVMKVHDVKDLQKGCKVLVATSVFDANILGQ
jgi:hypothetical protein